MNKSHINNMKKLILVFVVLLSIFLGCVQKTPDTTPTVTAEPTAIAYTPTVTPVAALTPLPTPLLRETTTYIIWIDSYSVNRVRAIEDSDYISLPSDFNVLNFTIKVGDKVRWVNDDSNDFPLTIISNEGLWEERGENYLRWQGDRFEYTFNKTGTFTFYIKEYPRIQQKITVIP